MGNNIKVLSSMDVTGCVQSTSAVSGSSICSISFVKGTILSGSTCVTSPVMVEGGICLGNKYLCKTNFNTYSGNTNTELDSLQTQIDQLAAIQATTIYYPEHITSDIPTYEVMTTSPTTLTGSTETISLNNNTVTFDTFATVSGQPGVTSIPAGLWTFHTHAQWSGITGNNFLHWDVYKRTSGGTESFILRASTPDIETTGLTEYQVSIVHSAVTTNFSDRLVLKILGQTTGGAKQASILYGGTVNFAFMQPPLTINQSPQWNSIQNRPAWLTGTTLTAFQNAHTHSQYALQTSIATYSGTTAPATYAPKANPTFTGLITAPNLKLTNVAAKTSETTIAYFKADGTILSGTSTGSGITWSGTTANGVGTYVSATCIASNTKLTFDGTTLEFASGVNRVVQMASVGAAAQCDIFFRGQCRTALNAGNGTAGGVFVDGGATATLSPAVGGYAKVRGGAATSTGTATGGDVCVVGGAGTINTSPGSGTGGNVCILGGIGNGNGGTSNCGCVMLHYGTTLRLNTTTVGVCVTGVLNTSACVDAVTKTTAACAVGTTCACSPVVLGSTCVCGAIVCSNTYIDIGTCALIGTNIVLTTGAARSLAFNAASSSGAGSLFTVLGNTGLQCTGGGATATAGGGVRFIAGAGGAGIAGASGGDGGIVCIIGGTGGATTATASNGGDVCIVGGAGSGAATNGDVCIMNGACLAILAVHSSCVALYYNNTLKFATTSAGGTLTGILCATTCVSSPIICSTTCGVGPDWVATSDIRLKKDIESISNALSTVTKLCGRCYHLCGDKNCEMNIGFVAQDVELVLPEIVSYSDPTEEDVKYGITDVKLGLKYDKLTAILVEAIKEQQQQIICLQQEINKLKK